MHQLLRKALRGLHRTTGWSLPHGVLAKSYSGVPGRIHIDDLMLRTDTPEEISRYLEGGRSAMRNIDASLARSGKTFSDIGSCLDFPCGYGRVLRHLVEKVKSSRVTASDADAQGVRFCAREFGAKPLLCTRDPTALRFPEEYDLIFVGSLLTHLPADVGMTTLSALVRALRPQGVLVFSTQGKTCLEHLSWYGPEFAATERTYRETVARDGFGFVPYRKKWLPSTQSPTDAEYGITIYARGYISEAMSRLGAPLALRRFEERGWEDHQDVWAYQRTDAGSE